MRLSELIEELYEEIKANGDVPVVLTIDDFRGEGDVIALDKVRGLRDTDPDCRGPRDHDGQCSCYAKQGKDDVGEPDSDDGLHPTECADDCSCLAAERIAQHVGHDIEVVTYGDKINASIECLDCGEVIASVDWRDQP